jgi:UPF0755 protein
LNPQFKKQGGAGVFLSACFGVLFVAFLGLGYIAYGLQPSGAEPAEIVVEPGESFKSINQKLSQKKLIRSVSAFKIYSLVVGSAHKFKPGVYRLAGTMSAPQIVSLLTRGGEDDVTVTIPEGTSLKDAEIILKNSGVLSASSSLNSVFPELTKEYPEFLTGRKSLEGFLFPDTYRLSMGSDTKEVARVFLDNFQTKAWPLLQKDSRWYERLISASILEREVPLFEDRQIVAGILLKRLRLQMPLQVDASVIYGKCDGSFKNCEGLLTKNDTVAVNSPYNSYQRLGWPPTPISNPGQMAIRAALSPKDSSYLYYLSSRASGETMFSKTLEEHNEKRAKFL